jgi:hypothetical protein
MYLAPGVAAGDPGYLYVVSSNFDRRFRSGKVTGIKLADLGLPPIGGGGSEPLSLESLGTIDERSVASLSGEMAGVASGPGGQVRLLIPSRAEGSLLQAVDAQRETLSCPFGDPEDCSVGAPSLVANERTATGKPRAPDPLAVAISQDGEPEAYVTHLALADSPTLSGTNYEGYVVRVNPFDLTVANESFISIGLGSSTAVAVGRRYAYVTGHLSALLRLVDRRANMEGRHVVQNPVLESFFRVADARGVALSSSPAGERIYLLGRRPDTLMVVHVPDPESDLPTLNIVHADLLETVGASQVKVIERPGRGNLAVISFIGTGAIDARGPSQGALAIYDEDAGQVVVQRSAFGLEPHGLAIQREGQGARIYVGLFGEGRLAVFDMPDVLRPQELKLVAWVGKSQACLTDESGAQECEVTQ